MLKKRSQLSPLALIRPGIFKHSGLYGLVILAISALLLYGGQSATYVEWASSYRTSLDHSLAASIILGPISMGYAAYLARWSLPGRSEPERFNGLSIRRALWAPSVHAGSITVATVIIAVAASYGISFQQRGVLGLPTNWTMLGVAVLIVLMWSVLGAAIGHVAPHALTAPMLVSAGLLLAIVGPSSLRKVVRVGGSGPPGDLEPSWVGVWSWAATLFVLVGLATLLAYCGRLARTINWSVFSPEILRTIVVVVMLLVAVLAPVGRSTAYQIAEEPPRRCSDGQGFSVCVFEDSVVSPHAVRKAMEPFVSRVRDISGGETEDVWYTFQATPIEIDRRPTGGIELPDPFRGSMPSFFAAASAAYVRECPAIRTDDELNFRSAVVRGVMATWLLEDAGHKPVSALSGDQRRWLRSDESVSWMRRAINDLRTCGGDLPQLPEPWRGRRE